MKKTVLLILVLINVFFVKECFCEQFCQTNLTIKAIGKFNGGVPAIWFNELGSDQNWLNGFIFHNDMINTPELRKELVAMLINAQNNNSKLDVWFERDGATARGHIIHFMIKTN